MISHYITFSVRENFSNLLLLQEEEQTLLEEWLTVQVLFLSGASTDAALIVP